MRWSIHKSVFEAHCNGRFIVKRVLQCNNRGCITLSHQLGARHCLGRWGRELRAGDLDYRFRGGPCRPLHHSPSGPSHRQVGEKIIKKAQIEICVFRGAEEVYPVVLNDAHMTTQISMYRTIAML